MLRYRIKTHHLSSFLIPAVSIDDEIVNTLLTSPLNQSKPLNNPPIHPFNLTTTTTITTITPTIPTNPLTTLHQGHPLTQTPPTTVTLQPTVAESNPLNKLINLRWRVNMVDIKRMEKYREGRKNKRVEDRPFHHRLMERRQRQRVRIPNVSTVNSVIRWSPHERRGPLTSDQDHSYEFDTLLCPHLE